MEIGKRPIGILCNHDDFQCSCLEDAQRDWDKKYWLNHRKMNEALLINLAMRTTKKTKKFVTEMARISKELEKCTTELDKLESESRG